MEEGFDNHYIDKSEYNAMDLTSCGPGRFYHTFKVHKEHPKGKLPPGRPIISGNG